MKFFSVRAIAVLAAFTAVAGVAEARYLGNVMPARLYIGTYPSFNKVWGDTVNEAHRLCRLKHPNYRSVSMKTFWTDVYFTPNKTYPERWYIKASWNCFDTRNGT
jgi:hypothetical protein